MEAHKEKLQQFMADWEDVKSALTCPHIVIEVGGKSPEELLQEIVDELQSEYNYVHLFLTRPCMTYTMQLHFSEVTAEFLS